MPATKHHKLLIANRGEIALRCMRSAAALKIPTVAVYMEADASAPHVFKADEAALVPAYIDQDAVLNVCREKGVTMIHPGYGFLSENEAFAAKVEKAGIIWLGPTPSQIEAMGLKHEARARAIKADVPVLPGSELVETLDLALEQAGKVGYPILLKATAGGGGMGMSICWSEAELKKAFQGTTDLSKNLFSNAGVFVEKYIPKARHIEVQVFGDGKGKVIHCGERECSAQRRQQKVLEEARSPFIVRHPDLGDAMCAAAVRLCELIDYRSAGTVEFIVDDSNASYYFLELNSRIQVEHAVTEMVRPGLDLVGMMIRLGLSQDGFSAFSLPPQEEVAQAHGHAIEARIYAEVPHLNFKPSPGLLQEVKWPAPQDYIRIDTWVDSGSMISPFFDPMIAKLITYGSTRDEARSRLDKALADTSLLGTTTNLAYLREIVNCDAFKHGDVTTKFLDSYVYLPSCIEVVDGGLSTTVQDGRPRLLPGGDGIPRSGFSDELAAKAVNLLVGNPEETEVFEATVSGPSLKFSTAAVVAVCGATAEIFLDDKPKPMWTRFVVPAGSTVEVGGCEGTGNRVYIAVRGGFPEVPLFLGSKSTFTAAKLGGIQGREVVAGDIITLSPSAAPTSADEKDFTLPSTALPSYPSEWTLAALPGPQADDDYLTEEDRQTLYSSTFTVSPASNRLGLRFDGLKPLKYSPRRQDGGRAGSHPSNCLEHGYTVGALNMNGDTPVLLGMDGPDCGGLICILGVVGSDWWKLGQMSAGDTFRFVLPTASSLPAHVAEQKKWLEAVKASVKSGSLDDLSSFPLDVKTKPQPVTDGVVKVIEGDAALDAPKLTFRLAGDGGLLIEVGEQDLFFRTRLIVELWERRLKAKKHNGLYTYIPGVASMLVKFHPDLISQDELLDVLVSTSDGLARESLDQVVPSRRIQLPVCFNDAGTKDVIEKYMTSTGRKKAVYLPSNIEYLAKANAFDGIDDIAKTFASADWYVCSRSFFAGLPMIAPLDQRCVLASQKYNPTRTFTQRGSLGYAGVMSAIYPVESPGGYQLLGRTLTPLSVTGRYGGLGHEKHFLLRNFDVVAWLPMSEEEFNKVEKDFDAGAFKPTVEDYNISAKEMIAFEESTRSAVQALAKKRKEGFEALAKQEAIYVAEYQAELQKAKEAEAAAASSAGGKTGSMSGTPLKSPVQATVRSIGVKVGDELTSDTSAIVLEAMKTQISVKLSRTLLGKKVTGIAVEMGDVVKPGQPLLYAE
ncbi:hypothetical protein NBRC10512_002530 [Rhodotorula toruloides]|uniref:RHTO0S01e07602g1_1 n=2 Tax=Rhodotorula toruloides TaxID=5286 RepID=A0A061AE47_RHOTO|nr:urea carboxylase / allophanate hydrolase [Rhodotorula toruloides NP11]EMS21703.1 urea carboxylase / allophanate hydrolase [Rhodotorula toruloides NP11]KAJ8292331.1 putative urea carboxylase [Rhodotorula toruloides]CDR35810.1 RHTO0S01e07602g1_1 [Rhodotorula toruloides]